MLSERKRKRLEKNFQKSSMQRVRVGGPYTILPSDNRRSVLITNGFGVVAELQRRGRYTFYQHPYGIGLIENTHSGRMAVFEIARALKLSLDECKFFADSMQKLRDAVDGEEPLLLDAAKKGASEGK